MACQLGTWLLDSVFLSKKSDPLPSMKGSATNHSDLVKSFVKRQEMSVAMAPINFLRLSM